MIVVRVELASAISRTRDTDLGTMIIANMGVSEDPKLGDYDVSMFRKGAIEQCEGDARKLVRTKAPTRIGKVLGHRRLDEPVHNLVAKALASMGYK